MPRTTGSRNRVYIRQPRARDRAWQSIRIMRCFALPDLVATAEIGEDNAKKFVRGLERAGYLKRVQEKRNGHKGGHVVYRLVRDTGPHTPRLQTDGRTYDTNEHNVIDGGIRQ